MRNSNKQEVSERTSDEIQEIGTEEIGFIDSDEEITGKIPIEKFCQINNTQFIFDEPVALVKVLLLKSNKDYINYYGKNIYAIYVKSENPEAWFGIPIKNPNLGLIKFEKSNWEKIYAFSLELTMQENV